MFGLMPLRMGATLAAVQGLVALLQAVMGLYAVVLPARRATRLDPMVALRCDLGP